MAPDATPARGSSAGLPALPDRRAGRPGRPGRAYAPRRGDRRAGADGRPRSDDSRSGAGALAPRPARGVERDVAPPRQQRDDRPGLHRAHAGGAGRPAGRARRADEEGARPGARPVGRLPGGPRAHLQSRGGAPDRQRRLSKRGRAHGLGGRPQARRRGRAGEGPGRRARHPQHHHREPRRAPGRGSRRARPRGDRGARPRREPTRSLGRPRSARVHHRDVTHERVQADWWFVDGVREPSDFVEHGASWLVRDGEHGLREGEGPV